MGVERGREWAIGRRGAVRSKVASVGRTGVVRVEWRVGEEEGNGE